ncbi:N-acetylgalactosaminyltransferase 7-like [Tropilaelaps mercedesae]|uniref:Polypeptide N-acetylgalactosaminyltransferase n=1 Tax=Tropilaelaps mercedesae TaxID=418985 RepID=A0A1V9X2Q3_9ACAR|nr:N-acetylgalactosaminyltransferase 7-like [Tropilaelaps mercedesae]
MTPRLGRFVKLSLALIACVFFALVFLFPNPETNRVLRPGALELQEEQQQDHHYHRALESAGRPSGAAWVEDANELPVYKKGKLGNFEQVEKATTGPGEGGRPYVISGHAAEQQRLKSQYGMNMLVSDMLSPNRTVPDYRLDECRYWHYPETMPKASVIIVFHNEGLSVLMRTVHSVVNRSPRHFLHEVVLVDDFSDMKNLKRDLEVYVQGSFPRGLVRLVRNSERRGLIGSRSQGAEVATGEIIVFLDAHCEVGTNWLPPLLAPIKANRKTMTVPVIDGIDHENFEYRPVYHGRQHFRGIFEWGMLYKEIEIPELEVRRRKYHSEPYKSPTHAGGLFAMDRKYFLELGGYDPGLLVWGGENFELSFKIWQCGGQILWVPCSRVGHVYRGFMPYSFGDLANKRKGPLVTINYKRVVEVWFDEFKEYFYTREPMARYYDAGDLTAQLELKKRLQCRPFSWFMKEVAYDVLKHFPYLPRNSRWGHLKTELNSQCVDSMHAHPPSNAEVTFCHGGGGNQLFRLNLEGQLSVGERCVDANNENMFLTYCKLGTVNGSWSYDPNTNEMKHTKNGITRCLDYSENQLRLSKCVKSDRQKFNWEEIH